MDMALKALEEQHMCADCKWFRCNIRGDGDVPYGMPEYECLHFHATVDPTDYCSCWKGE